MMAALRRIVRQRYSACMLGVWMASGRAIRGTVCALFSAGAAMIRIHRYRPAYFDGFERPEDDLSVENTQALLDVPWIKRWADEEPEFYRFSISDGTHLMAELKGGAEWWVVCYFPDGAAGIDLPEWRYEDVKHLAKP